LRNLSFVRIEKMNDSAQSVSNILFSNLQDGEEVYAVLDGASVPDLLDHLYVEHDRPDFQCLYRGELEPDVAEVAPYLVRLEAGSAFAEWVLGSGWGQHWGIFLIAGSSLNSVRQHFSTFVIVHDPEGKPMRFRFYDPRVFRTYLPTCNGDELERVFGPIQSYVVEDEDFKVALRFQKSSGELVTETLAMSELREVQ
jgi:Domain of unknown function (DUF4123)